MIDPIDETDLVIDRLVDGDLPDEERRELLIRLDTDPDGPGWRRLALAFLEAQAWRDSLVGPAREAVPLPLRPSKTAPPRRHRAGLALAAAVLAAFGLGWALRGAPTSRPSGPIVADLDHATEPTLADPAPTWRGDWLAPDPRQLARLVAGPLHGPDASLTPRLPDEVLEGLERRGYRVEQRPGLAALELDDGRRVVVPAGQVRLDYVGHPTL